MFSIFGQDPFTQRFMGDRSPYQVRQYPGYRIRNQPRRNSSFYESDSEFDPRRRYVNSNYNREIPITRKRNMYNIDYQSRLEERQKLIELKKR